MGMLWLQLYINLQGNKVSELRQNVRLYVLKLHSKIDSHSVFSSL